MKIAWGLVLLGLCSAAAWADYRINWYTIDGGGGTMRGGAYELTGTIGQADAGAAFGGDYKLLSGYWAGETDCRVDLAFFAEFAAHWLEGPCDASNFWCGGADLDQANDVNMDDFLLLVSAWLGVCP